MAELQRTPTSVAGFGAQVPAADAGVLYAGLASEGAVSEISFDWGQLNSRSTKPVTLHTLRVVTPRTLKLLK